MDSVEEVHVDELDDITIPVVLSIEEMTDKELMMTHYDAWCACRDSDSYSGSDERERDAAREELAKREWATYPQEGVYRQYESEE